MEAAAICLLLIFVIQVNSDCELESLTAAVPDEAFNASSTWNSAHSPEEARISTGESWCSKVLTNISDSPWIQVDLGDNYEIHSVGVAGHRRRITSDYIVNYHVLYGSTNGSLEFVKDPRTGQAKVFPRLKNNFLQKRQLPTPVIGQVVRIMALPGSWNRNQVCIQFEVTGCRNLPNIFVDSSTVPPPIEASSIPRVFMREMSSITLESVAKTSIEATTSSIPPAALTTNTLMHSIEPSVFAGTSLIVLTAAVSAVSASIITMVTLGLVFGLSVMIWRVYKKRRDMKRIRQEHNLDIRQYHGYELKAIPLYNIETVKYDRLARENSNRSSDGVLTSSSTSVLYESIKIDQLQYDYVTIVSAKESNRCTPLKCDSVEPVAAMNRDQVDTTDQQHEELVYNPLYGKST